MADRGILFSAPMVRALLEGRKTQTRRLLNPQPKVFPIDVDGTPCEVGCLHVEDEPRPRITTGKVLTAQTLPHAKGDRLYVREAFSYAEHLPETVWYWADGNIAAFDCEKPKPSIHMPRWASRLWLRVTDVRVQRVQDISSEDALAEGVDPRSHVLKSYRAEWREGACVSSDECRSYVPAYAALWDSLHIKSGTRWQDNPWIYAVTFEVKLGNIDAGAA